MMDGSNQEEMGKMFVGGLSWETTQEALCRYFSRFGEVIDSVVMKNPETGRSRGFGFVTFKDPCCVQIVLDSGPHTLDARTISYEQRHLVAKRIIMPNYLIVGANSRVDPKACNPRTQQKPMRTREKGQYPKIFLGGLPSNVTETDLKNYFSKYGNVVEVVIMYDQEKKRTRGFGFVSFVTEDCVDQVCAEQFVSINGKQVECKKAEPRESSRGMGGGGGGGGGSYSRRGMRNQNGPSRGRSSMHQQQMGGPPGGGGSGMGPSQMSMPNGMGYQPQGWGPPSQAGYSAQGGGYGGQAGGSGYAGWGPQPGAYGSYGAPAPSYGPQSYSGYGYGYNWPGQVPTPVPAPGSVNGSMTAGQPVGVSSDVYGVAQQQTLSDGASAAVAQGMSSAGGSNPQTPVKSDFGAYSSSTYGSMSNYSQEPSGFGPSRSYGSDGQGSYGGQGDSSQSNTYSGGSGRASSQAYHPYRRP